MLLQAYSSNLVDYHLILDLLPSLTRLYLSGQLPATLSYGQAAILLCLGLQQREVAEIEKDLGLPSNQVSQTYESTCYFDRSLTIV
jgi:N-acetyltransferase 10